MRNDTSKLKGQTILVTGGARRIGAAIVRDLARAGANVIIHCHHSVTEAEDVARDVQTLGVKASVVRGDLSAVKGVDAFMNAVLLTAGDQLDGLVNSASHFPESHLLTVSPDELEASLRLHATAPLLLARRMAALGKRGSIVNLLDARVTMYDAQHAAYHLGKRMLLTMTRMLALELAPSIRVNAVAPGAVLQPDGQPVARLEHWAQFNPLQQHGTPEGVADCVRFLLTSDFITGQTLFYDGGYHLKAATYG